jgi:hypothetical protein
MLVRAWFSLRLYWDGDSECHALEVWPHGIEESEDHGGNGHQETNLDLFYELAEFDFISLLNLPLEHFHFSQQRQIFEIGWEEDDQTYTSNCRTIRSTQCRWSF